MSAEDISEELQSHIDERKGEAFTLIYRDGENMYLIVGYGSQEGGGYSIRVNDLYLGNKCGLCRCRFIRAGGRRGYNGTANHAVYCVKN